VFQLKKKSSKRKSHRISTEETEMSRQKARAGLVADSIDRVSSNGTDDVIDLDSDSPVFASDLSGTYKENPGTGSTNMTESV